MFEESAFAAQLLKNSAFSFIFVLRKKFPDAHIYLVGGVVRDARLGRTLKDFDFVVRGIPLPKLQQELKKLGEVNLVGQHFGVLKFVPKELRGKAVPAFDIALPRLEFSTHETGHYRDFTVQSDYRLPIEDDLARRDFTINAMAFDLTTSQLIDPWGGRQDLEKKVIRAVGEPHHRFREDYSRMLRAVRFSCQLGFALHPHTAKALIENASGLQKTIRAQGDLSKKHENELIRAVPYEVIGRELVKALVANPLKAIELYDKLSLWKYVVPEVLAMKKCPQPKTWHSEGDVWKHSLLAVQSLYAREFVKEFGSDKPDALLILATFLHDIGKPMSIKTPKKDKVDRIRFDGHDRVGAGLAREICERLRTSSVEGHNIDPENVHWLIKNHLLLLNCDLKTLKNTTIEKYFFKNLYLGNTLLKLSFVDGSASITSSGKKGLDRYGEFKKRLVQFKKTSGTKKELPKSLLDGDEVMVACTMKPGPRIGDLLTLLREEQLAGRIKTKAAAKVFVKKECAVKEQKKHL